MSTSPNDPTVQDPSLDQGVLSSAQVPGSPNHDSPFSNVIPAWVQLTDAIYIASKPKRVQQLYDITGSQGPSFAEKRLIGAMELASEGFVVDYWSDALGNSPTITMLLRQEMSIGSVWSINSVAIIPTSLDPAKYPPFYPPPPPAPPAGTPDASIVGGFLYNDGTNRVFRSGPAAIPAYVSGIFSKTGDKVMQGGVTYYARVSETLMGTAIAFTIPN